MIRPHRRRISRQIRHIISICRINQKSTTNKNEQTKRITYATRRDATIRTYQNRSEQIGTEQIGTEQITEHIKSDQSRAETSREEQRNTQKIIYR